MSWGACYGRECKLGWGYNDPLDLLIPVQGESLNVASEPVNQWWYWVYPLSSDRLVHWVGFLFIHSTQYEYFSHT